MATTLAIVLATGVSIRLAWLAIGLIRLRQSTARAQRPAEAPPLFATLARRLGASAELRITDGKAVAVLVTLEMTFTLK